jgi:uncharacterized protein YdeI (BOF family)
MKKHIVMFAVAAFAFPVLAQAQFGFKKPVIAAPSKDEIAIKGVWKPVKAKIDDLLEKLKAVAEEKAKELDAKIIARI